MIFTWSFRAFYDIPGAGKYGFSRSETLNKEFQVHFSEETKIYNPSSNTTLIFCLFQKWNLKLDDANSDTLRVVNNTYIQG